jgi:flagellin
MSRVNFFVSSMVAQRLVTGNTRQLAASLERLSTGYRINRGGDDPAGLIASESMRGDLRGISAALSNAERAEQVVNIAEGGLQEVSSMLVEMQGLVAATANDAGMSADEREANQMQIDSILSTIDRLSGSVSFQGTKLLNGNYDYVLSGGGSTSGFVDVTVNGAKLSDTGAVRAVTVQVTQSAQRATVYMSAGASFNNNNGGTVTFEITGNRGSQQFAFASGTTIANVATAINSFGEAMGVSATTSGSLLMVRSTGYGTDSFVRMREVSGGATGRDWLRTAATGANSDTVQDTGRNATMLINGMNATTNGLVGRISTDGLDIAVTINGANGINVNNQTRTIGIKSGGADFNLSPDVNLAGKVSIGFDTITTGSLGNAAAGFLSDLRSGGAANVQSGNLTKAQEILDAATKQVSALRGRLGAFSKTVIGSTVNSLNVAYENVAAAESAVRDTDFAREIASMTRNQVLQEASMQALRVSNDSQGMILRLLG